MVHIEQCQLLGDRFGVVMQLLLGAVSLFTLMVKRYQEKPRRSWPVWARDASKQCLGSLLGHGWNIVYAQLLVSTEFVNPCVFYFVSYILADNLLGIALNYFCLREIIHFTKKYFRSNIMDSGNYGNPARNSIWFCQVMVWFIIVSVVKAFLFFCFLSPLRHSLYTIGSTILAPLHPFPRVELGFVMILVPFVVNAIQFWVTDSYLMTHQPSAAPASAPDTLSSGAGPPHFSHARIVVTSPSGAARGFTRPSDGKYVSYGSIGSTGSILATDAVGLSNGSRASRVDDAEREGGDEMQHGVTTRSGDDGSISPPAAYAATVASQSISAQFSRDIDCVPQAASRAAAFSLDTAEPNIT